MSVTTLPGLNTSAAIAAIVLAPERVLAEDLPRVTGGDCRGIWAPCVATELN